MTAGQWRGRLRRYMRAPAWMIYRFKNLGEAQLFASGPEPQQVEQLLAAKEDCLRNILMKSPRGSFLEIGIGGGPIIDRLRLMAEAGIKYTGCDFEYVCRVHEKAIGSQMGNPPDVRFLTNRVGTYSWQLFECLTRGETFDVIYLDGHHTFYVDLPAMVIADLLLKPGGHLMLDDITWNLPFLRANMVERFSDWNFYHTMYDFTQYDSKQQQVEHIRWIAEEFLLKRRGYKSDSLHSTTLWWLLRKPDTAER